MKFWGNYTERRLLSWSCIRYMSAAAKSNRSKRLVLGIETSCDETGAAVVDEDGRLLGESLNSQKRIHVKNGGVIPTLAQHLHQQCIHDVVHSALVQAKISYKDLSAVATTTRPGLALSLKVGLDYTKWLVDLTELPFIPVHHMEAHALTARMIDKSLSFPFLVLLVSGGHCILALARNVGDFLILGETLDGAPGEALDKIARRLKLQEHPECQGMSGGQAIESLAKGGNIHLLDNRHLFRMRNKDCNFSFVAMKQIVARLIEKEEKSQGTSNPLENISDICASVQHQITRHIATRILRGMEYCKLTGLILQERQTLVVSGGVGSNSYIRNALGKLCDHTSYRLVCPPPKLCTDNGIMIAWAGMEHLKLGTGVAVNPQQVRFEPREPLGLGITSAVTEARIDIKTFKFWIDGLSKSAFK